MSQPTKRTSTASSVAHAASIAGCSESLILALAERGILESVSTPFGPSITTKSLVKWLNSRPEILRLPPPPRLPETRKGASQ